MSDKASFNFNRGSSYFLIPVHLPPSFSFFKTGYLLKFPAMRVPILIFLCGLLAAGNGCRRECECPPVDCSTTGMAPAGSTSPAPGPAVTPGASVVPGPTSVGSGIGPTGGTTAGEAVPLAEKKYCASESGEVFHRCGCASVKRIKSGKLVRFTSRAEALASGRRPCKQCKP